MGRTELTFNWQMFLFCMIILFILIVGLLISNIVARMANKRGRSATGWFLLSLIISPFLCMLFLLALGETEEKRRQRIIEEEKLRSLYRH